MWNFLLTNFFGKGSQTNDKCDQPSKDDKLHRLRLRSELHDLLMRSMGRGEAVIVRDQRAARCSNAC